MTKLEASLLDILKEDCRIPLEKLAVMTGTSMEEVAAAIEDLENRKIILRYSPMINWDRTDRERVEAMIEVRVTPQRDMGFDAIARRIYRFDEVKSVYLMSGSYDLLVLVEARTLKELAAFVASKLSPLETVTGTATSFVLKRYKAFLSAPPLCCAEITHRHLGVLEASEVQGGASAASVENPREVTLLEHYISCCPSHQPC